VPYPSVKYNSPPGGAINRTTTPQVTSANYDNYFVSVQAVVVDPLDRLWAVDTGRAIDPETNMLTDNTGGCKLVQLNLNNNTVARTITFPPTVCYRESPFLPFPPRGTLPNPLQATPTSTTSASTSAPTSPPPTPPASLTSPIPPPKAAMAW